jgi:vesicle coat complex subunit
MVLYQTKRALDQYNQDPPPPIQLKKEFTQDLKVASLLGKPSKPNHNYVKNNKFEAVKPLTVKLDTQRDTFRPNSRSSQYSPRFGTKETKETFRSLLKSHSTNKLSSNKKKSSPINVKVALGSNSKIK